MDLELFDEAHKAYSISNVSEETWLEYYSALFFALSKVQPTNLVKDHLKFMKLSEDFFSLKEDYKKADILSKLQVAANDIFEARDIVEKITNKRK